MASTEQRSGFRLPWAAEPRSDPAADQAASETPNSSTEATIGEDTVTQDTSTTTSDLRSAVWPTSNGAPDDSELATEAAGRGATAADTAAPAARTRRDNPLVAGLVRAMRDAAQIAKDESMARYAEAAKARVEGIHAESAEGAAEIRSKSDEDVAGIREWSKAEMARIKEETEERIAARRRRLELEVDEHAAGVEHRIELVKTAVSKFETDMEGFYASLMAEEDPARLAGFAELLPEPPAFDDADLEAWAPPRTLDAGVAAAAEADFLAGIDESDIDASDIDMIGDTASPENSAVDENPVGDEAAAPSATHHGSDGDLDVVERLATFTDPAAGREASVSSRLSVVGLVSVSSIAGFKRAVGRAPDVSGVSVASGPNGDFIFTVQHAATTDIRTLIPELDGFTASITGDADGVLTVTATELAEAS